MEKRVLYLLLILLALTVNSSFADKACPACETIFDDSIKFCPNDGTKLNEISRKDIISFELRNTQC